jgi:hypothetical protein
MKKFLIVLGLLFIAAINLQGVYAAEEVVAEESTFDNWISVVSDFASLKNFILSVSGLTLISVLLKVRSMYKFIKSPSGVETIYTHAEKFLARISDKPELLTSILTVFAQLPIVKQIADRAIKTADRIDLELEGKIIDLKAKIGADVFANDQDKQQAIQYLAKLVDEYENIKSS